MANPAHLQKVEVSTDGLVFTEVDGINSKSFKPVRNLVETTVFKGNGGARKNTATLASADVDISGFLESADNNGMRKVIEACDAGTELHFRLHFNVGGGAGTVGVQLKTLVENYELSDEVEDVTQFSATAKSQGMWTWF